MPGSLMPGTDDLWNNFRSQMPVTQTWAYFDHAAVGPLSRPAADAFQSWSADLVNNGVANWPRWRKRMDEVRRLAARMIGAKSDEIALVNNTTHGVNLVAEGFPWKPGDNVVTPAGEFPSNYYPWLNLQSRGVEVRQIPTTNERWDLDQLADACDDRTRLITLSWVGYMTGWRNDIAAVVELAHRRGTLVFVDAIQGLGVLPLNVAAIPIDFLAADGHKWLLGPEGAGFFYMRPDHLDLLRPLGVGWNSAANAGEFSSDEFTPKKNAGRYEGGSYNMAGFHALGASVELLLDVGQPAIEQRLLDVTNRLAEEISRLGGRIVSSREPDRSSGILSCEFAGHDPLQLKASCKAAEVIVNCRGGYLRLSPHVYTNDEDIARLTAALQDAVGQNG